VRAALILLVAAVLPLTGIAGPADAHNPDRMQSRSRSSSGMDPLRARAVGDLAAFTNWLASAPGRARGLVGEVGWPGEASSGGDARWNRLAADWYGRAARSRLWVAAWAAGEFWEPSYKLLAYGWAPHSGGRPNAQASVIERQRARELRGMNLAGAEFAAPVAEARSSFSNENTGVYGRDYVYPSRELLRYLAGRGITFVRLPLRWERLQPELRRPLDPDEVGRLRRCVEEAGRAGLAVILDVHNYGAYYLAARDGGVRRAIGSPEVPTASFADLWRRLSEIFAADSTVIGYGLMNEPIGMAGASAWEAASRLAVRAIRSRTDPKRIFVQSYFWGGARQFSRYHPRGPWISDSNTWYEAHQYFDRDRSARYVASYEDEARALAGRARG
jgi:Cellulase (glycosyl hydrolase family 5)